MKIVVVGTNYKSALLMEMNMRDAIKIQENSEIIEIGLSVYSIPNESYYDDNINGELTQREKELESLENLRKSKRKWKR